MALGLAISSCSDIRNRFLFISCSVFPCWHHFQAGLPHAVEETATGCSTIRSHRQKEKVSFLEFQVSPASEGHWLRWTQVPRPDPLPAQWLSQWRQQSYLGHVRTYPVDSAPSKAQGKNKGRCCMGKHSICPQCTSSVLSRIVGLSTWDAMWIISLTVVLILRYFLF